jgi:hypothetical protein
MRKIHLLGFIVLLALISLPASQDATAKGGVNPGRGFEPIQDGSGGPLTYGPGFTCEPTPTDKCPVQGAANICAGVTCTPDILEEDDEDGIVHVEHVCLPTPFATACQIPTVGRGCLLGSFAVECFYTEFLNPCGGTIFPYCPLTALDDGGGCGLPCEPSVDPSVQCAKACFYAP